MECPRRWALIFFLVYLTTVSNVYCQDGPFGDEAQNQQLKRDVSRIMNPSPKPITYVTEAPFVASLISSPASYYAQDPVTMSPNIVLSAPGTRVSAMPSYTNDIFNSPTINPVMYAEVTPPPLNLQIRSPGLDLFSANNKQKDQDPVILASGYEDGFPVNLQINLPSQSVPAPRITVVSAAPQPTTTVNSEKDSKIAGPFGYPPPFPIIKKKSKSSLRHMLPILLIALLSDQGNCGNRCCCPCNCNCGCGGDSGSPIPIPYPIPVPTNNPIINNPSSKRGRQRDDDDD